MTFALRYAARTHSGRVRGNNEDNYYAAGSFRADVGQKEAAWDGTAEDGRLLAAVCDGMGGHAQGEVASLLAAQALAELDAGAKDESVFGAGAAAAVAAVNQRVSQTASREQNGMGTTLAALEFSDGQVLAVNVGDSRAYRLRGGQLRQLSVDHTLVADMVRRGQITAEEAKSHPLRHHITQYLGIPPEELVLEPSCAGPEPLQAGDSYLVCSDGLTDMLDDGTIAALLGQPLDGPALAERLVQAALDAGGRDNVTVVLVQVQRRRQGLTAWLDKLTGRT